MCEKIMEPTDAETNSADTADGGDEPATYVCPDCGAPMLVIDIFLGGQLPLHNALAGHLRTAY